MSNFRNYPTVVLPSINYNNFLQSFSKLNKVMSVLNQIIINYNTAGNYFSPTDVVLRNMMKHGDFSRNTYHSSLKKLIEFNVLTKKDRNYYELNTDCIKLITK